VTGVFFITEEGLWWSWPWRSGECLERLQLVTVAYGQTGSGKSYPWSDMEP